MCVFYILIPFKYPRVFYINIYFQIKIRDIHKYPIIVFIEYKH